MILESIFVLVQLGRNHNYSNILITFSRDLMLLANDVVEGFDVETLWDVEDVRVEVAGGKGVVVGTMGVLREVVSTTLLGRQV